MCFKKKKLVLGLFSWFFRISPYSLTFTQNTQNIFSSDLSFINGEPSHNDSHQGLADRHTLTHHLHYGFFFSAVLMPSKIYHEYLGLDDVLSVLLCLWREAYKAIWNIGLISVSHQPQHSQKATQPSQKTKAHLKKLATPQSFQP